MVLLALETVTPAGSLAICRDGHVVGQVGNTTTPHAARLPMALVDYLASHGLALTDVDRLAVVCGPGSFTGVRIGMACVQGLAVTRGLDVAAVSTLEAIAEGWRAGLPGAPPQTVVACLDGMRGEVFFAPFLWDGHRMRSVGDAAVGAPSPSVVEELAGPVTVVGSGAVKYADVWRAAGVDTVRDALEPLAASAARLAAGPAWPVVSPHALRPVYVRRPDVELARDRRALDAQTPGQ
jgi:tRNA threonylcarbamoyladenosine biosynthesis protein TsaB